MHDEEDIVRDHYRGFEGEPEIQFVRHLPDGRQIILRMWDGYFDAIMNLVEPSVDGWNGLALPYHLDTGWYEESPWEVKNLSEVSDQVCEIDESLLDQQVQSVLEDMRSLLGQALEAGDHVFILYC